MSLTAPVQRSLFERGDVDFDPRLTGVRTVDLARGAWVDHLPGWLHGDDVVFEALWSGMRWRHERRWMYERMIDVPRLVATVPDDGDAHPVLPDLAAALSRRYGHELSDISLAAYRDGRDSVAFHGDRMGRASDNTIVALVSLGAPRRFLLRPKGGGSSRSFDLGWGDLLVMGGTCQRTWEHAVPKLAGGASPRISVQFRPLVPDED